VRGLVRLTFRSSRAAWRIHSDSDNPAFRAAFSKAAGSLSCSGMRSMSALACPLGLLGDSYALSLGLASFVLSDVVFSTKEACPVLHNAFVKTYFCSYDGNIKVDA
jgi:hypothetical protein